MSGPTACGVSPSANPAARPSPSVYNLPEWQPLGCAVSVVPPILALPEPVGCRPSSKRTYAPLARAWRASPGRSSRRCSLPRTWSTSRAATCHRISRRGSRCSSSGACTSAMRSSYRARRSSDASSPSACGHRGAQLGRSRSGGAERRPGLGRRHQLDAFGPAAAHRVARRRRLRNRAGARHSAPDRSRARPRAGATQPPPQALFQGFGESTLDFVLRVWFDMEYDSLLLRSELALATHGRLGEAGITIPFPQRDLHLASVSPEVSVVLAGKEGAEPDRVSPSS